MHLFDGSEGTMGASWSNPLTFPAVSMVASPVSLVSFGYIGVMFDCAVSQPGPSIYRVHEAESY